MSKPPKTHAIKGGAMGVHRELGDGFLEAVDQEAQAMESTSRRTVFRGEAPLKATYQGQRLTCACKAGHIRRGEIWMEPETVEHPGNPENARAIRRLITTKTRRALHFNFGSPSLEQHRAGLNHPDSTNKNNPPPSAPSAGL